MSEGLQDTAGESSKMSKGGATSEEPCKSGSGAGGESESEDSSEVDDSAEPCDFGGGLIEIADDGEPVESYSEYIELSRSKIWPRAVLEKYFKIDEAAGAAQGLTEERIGQMITQGTLDCELSIDIDALLLKGVRLDCLTSLYPAGSLQAMSATPRKMTHGIGNRDRDLADALQIGMLDFFTLSVDKSSEPFVIRRIRNAVSEPGSSLPKIFLSLKEEGAETLFKRNGRVLMTDFLRASQMAGIRSFVAKSAGMKWTMQQSVEHVQIFEKCLAPDPEGNVEGVAGEGSDVAFEIKSGEFLRIFCSSPAASQDGGGSLLKFSLESIPELSFNAGYGYTNPMISRFQPGTGYVKIRPDVLKHALGNAFDNGEDVTAFDVIDSKEPPLFKPQNRSFLEKVVIYSPLRHSLLERFPEVRYYQRNSELQVGKLVKHFETDAVRYLNLLRSQIVMSLVGTFLRESSEEESLNDLRVHLKDRLHFDTGVKITDAEALDSLEDLFDQVGYSVYNRHSDGKREARESLSSVFASFKSLEQEFCTVRVEASWQNFTLFQSILLTRQHVVQGLANMCSDGLLQVFEACNLRQYHLNLELVYALVCSMKRPGSLNKMLQIKTSAKGSYLAAIVHFLDAAGEAVSNGRKLLSPYPLKVFFQKSNTNFWSILQGGALCWVFEQAFVHPTSLEFLSVLANLLSSRVRYCASTPGVYEDREVEALGRIHCAVMYAQLVVQQYGLNVPPSREVRALLRERLQRSEELPYLFKFPGAALGKPCGIDKRLLAFVKLNARIGLEGLKDIHTRAIHETFDSFFSAYNGPLLSGTRELAAVVFKVRHFPLGYTEYNGELNEPLPRAATDEELAMFHKWVEKCEETVRELRPVFWGEFDPKSYFESCPGTLESVGDYVKSWKLLYLVLVVEKVRELCSMHHKKRSGYTSKSVHGTCIKGHKFHKDDSQFFLSALDMVRHHGVFFTVFPVKYYIDRPYLPKTKQFIRRHYVGGDFCFNFGDPSEKEILVRCGFDISWTEAAAAQVDERYHKTSMYIRRRETDKRHADNICVFPMDHTVHFEGALNKSLVEVLRFVWSKYLKTHLTDSFAELQRRNPERHAAIIKRSLTADSAKLFYFLETLGATPTVVMDMIAQCLSMEELDRKLAIALPKEFSRVCTRWNLINRGLFGIAITGFTHHLVVRQYWCLSLSGSTLGHSAVSSIAYILLNSTTLVEGYLRKDVLKGVFRNTTPGETERVFMATFGVSASALVYSDDGSRSSDVGRFAFVPSDKIRLERTSVFGTSQEDAEATALDLQAEFRRSFLEADATTPLQFREFSKCGVYLATLLHKCQRLASAFTFTVRGRLSCRQCQSEPEEASRVMTFSLLHLDDSTCSSARFDSFAKAFDGRAAILTKQRCKSCEHCMELYIDGKGIHGKFPTFIAGAYHRHATTFTLPAPRRYKGSVYTQTPAQDEPFPDVVLTSSTGESKVYSVYTVTFQLQKEESSFHTFCRVGSHFCMYRGSLESVCFVPRDYLDDYVSRISPKDEDGRIMTNYARLALVVYSSGLETVPIAQPLLRQYLKETLSPVQWQNWSTANPWISELKPKASEKELVAVARSIRNGWKKLGKQKCAEALRAHEAEEISLPEAQARLIRETLGKVSGGGDDSASSSEASGESGDEDASVEMEGEDFDLGTDDPDPNEGGALIDYDDDTSLPPGDLVGAAERDDPSGKSDGEVPAASGGASSKEKELPRGPGVGATEDSPIAGLNFLRGLRKGVVHQYNAMQNWALLSKTREGLLRGLDLVSPRRGIGKRGGETPRSSSDDASEGKAKAKEVLGAGVAEDEGPHEDSEASSEASSEAGEDAQDSLWEEDSEASELGASVEPSSRVLTRSRGQKRARPTSRSGESGDHDNEEVIFPPVDDMGAADSGSSQRNKQSLRLVMDGVSEASQGELAAAGTSKVNDTSRKKPCMSEDQSWMIEPSLAEGGTDVKGEVVLAVSQPRERSIIGALTQVEKAMLEKHVGLNPKRILNRSEVAGFVKDLNNAKWRRVKKYVCVVLRPKLRKAHDSNSATGSSTAGILSELPTKYSAAQGHALVHYFGSSKGGGPVLTRSAENLNNFLKINSSLFPGFVPSKKTYKTLRSLWYRYEELDCPPPPPPSAVVASPTPTAPKPQDQQTALPSPKLDSPPPPPPPEPLSPIIIRLPPQISLDSQPPPPPPPPDPRSPIIIKLPNPSKGLTGTRTTTESRKPLQEAKLTYGAKLPATKSVPPTSLGKSSKRVADIENHSRELKRQKLGSDSKDNSVQRPRQR